MEQQCGFVRLVVACAKSITPPIVWNAVRSVARCCFPPATPRERGSEYYDELYRRPSEYHVHYTRSRYYFLWAVIVDRLVRANAKSILDIGCGAGQFAELVRDAGIPEYVGLDFSSEAIRRARERCPEFTFVVDNALTSPLVAEPRFDAVVAMEVLEHIEDDIGLVSRIPAGTRCFFTVPNFTHPAHVRVFANCDAVQARYGSLFRDLDVRAFKGNEAGSMFFVLEGVRK